MANIYVSFLTVPRVGLIYEQSPHYCLSFRTTKISSSDLTLLKFPIG